jgi:pyruvate/2-oxoglutarate dehydrogenase complex dihydrolipoamide dehydrogenase (E3) component
MDIYDLIVIGTGTAAQATAARVRRAGRSVAVIDHRPFGGTCALRGCDPKKMLVSGAGRRPIGRAGCIDAASLANCASTGKS